MPEPIITPYIPQTITVHLGPPNSDAENVTVSFSDYVKNVASSEIYPTWEPAAIRANVLAIISFALNRVYTDYYPSRGYPFQITSSTAYDQKFIKGRSIFENVGQIVDDVFRDYIRYPGHVEPLAAKFCNGTTSTCDGLSQWGSQALAEQGYNSVDILRHYYGDDIQIVTGAPVKGVQSSYPGTPLRLGDQGQAVIQIQTMLNRISRDYPAIPKIPVVDGIFGANTQAAVRRFLEIFSLVPDGVVGSATWYKMVYLYVGILDLAELISEGQTFTGFSFVLPETLSVGDTSPRVRLLQYMLAVVATFYNTIPMVALDSIYGPATSAAVQAVQQMAGLPPSDTVDSATWEALYRMYAGIVDTMDEYTNVVPEPFRPEIDDALPANVTQFPGRSLSLGDSDTMGGSIS